MQTSQTYQQPAVCRKQDGRGREPRGGWQLGSSVQVGMHPDAGQAAGSPGALPNCQPTIFCLILVLFLQQIGQKIEWLS